MFDGPKTEILVDTVSRTGTLKLFYGKTLCYESRTGKYFCIEPSMFPWESIFGISINSSNNQTLTLKRNICIRLNEIKQQIYIYTL